MNSTEPFVDLKRHTGRLLAEIGKPQDDGERRPQLVAGHLDKGLFEIVRLPQLRVGRLELLVFRLQLGRQLAALDNKIVVLRRLPEDRLQFLGIKGLGDVAIHAALIDGVNDRLDVGVCGKQQADNLRVRLPQTLEELDTGHLRHPLVGHDDIDVLLLDDLETVGGARGTQDAVVEPQQVLNAMDQIGFIIHDQQAVFGPGTHVAVTGCPRQITFFQAFLPRAKPSDPGPRQTCRP